ncbi:hypothetical protein [Pseudogemmobacter bohemicus]|uniref:hypothetical protein n=1 Tax=Pseudogemmobacter bohemicus TaxID=2250708 RepID=UPI000DD36222|nr:hypothetical protein [Pseudogemmobacter bohemicus]
MSLHDCIQRAIDSGDLPPKRARAAQDLFAERMQAHASAGPAAADLAAEDVWVMLRERHILAKRSVLMQAEAQIRMVRDTAAYRDADGVANGARAVRAHIEWDQDAGFGNVQSTFAELVSQYRRDISGLIEDHSRNIFGRVRSKASLINMVRELYGEASGDARAKANAKAARETIERARREFNAAGGDIRKLEGYGLPQHWDRAKVSAVPRGEWAERMHDTQDWARIVDRETGLSFDQSSRARRIGFLEQIHDNIRTGGLNRREPSGQRGGRSVAKSRADHRVLHFKNADAWLKANDEFGTADPFSAVLNHLDGMARDTAQMRVLGPNPAAGLEFLKQTALKLAVERPWTPSKPITMLGKGLPWYSTAEKEVGGVAAQAERMLGLINGAANQVESDLFAGVMAETRHFLIASQLGGAMLSSTGDVGFMATASRHVGMDPKKVLTRFVATLAKPENRAQLRRAGIIAESAANTGVIQARMFGETFNGASMANLSEFVMRASGLTAWTDIARGVFKLEFYGHLADNAHLAFADLPKSLRELVFEARGITAADWDMIRATDLYRDAADPKASFLIPGDIARRTDIDPDLALDLSLKIGAAIQEQLEFAVPTMTLRGKTALRANAPAGTFGGEILRSVEMYKSYPLTLMFNLMSRVLYHKVNGSRLGNVLAFAAVGVIGGAVAIQMKEVLTRGRDPRDMTKGEFWAEALLQGGGLGIFGDFIRSSENRFGGGFAATAAGPVAGLVSDTGFLTMDVARAIWNRDEKSARTAAKSAVKFANRYGGPTNLWQVNSAIDRMVWDTITEWLDPGAADAFATAEKKRVKDYGNRSWAPPGGPVRLPDFSSVYGYGGAP